MSHGLSDTNPTIERILIAGYRRMSPWERLERVAALNGALDELVAARLQASGLASGDARALALHTAALRLSPELMRRAFAWPAGPEGG